MVRNGKTGGTNNFPQPAMTLEEAVRFYGWEHLAPGTQQRLRGMLRRFESAPSRLIVERRLCAPGLVAMCVASLGPYLSLELPVCARHVVFPLLEVK